MRVLLCDDDKRDIDKLETLIDKYGAANNIQFNIDSYSAGEELLEDVLKGKNADMFFLVKDDLEHTFSECMDDICSEIIKKRKSMMFHCVDGLRTILD